MRKSLLTVAVLGMAVSFSGCSKFGAKKVLSPDEAGKKLATILCEKHAGCQQDAEFNKEQCLQDISTGLTERLKSKTDLKLEQALLDACTKTITAGDCALLTSETPPAGCEFLE